MIHTMDQGTPEWDDIRRGKVSASHIAEVLSKGKGSAESAGVRNYRARLVIERLTNKTEETFCSFDMQRGIELEPDARSRYEFESGETVNQVGWVDHPTIELAGSSPDGLIGEDGHIEIKCCNAATHLDYYLTEKIDGKYILQMQFQMACSGREYCDFVSFHPDFPEDKQLKIIRVFRDDEKIAEIEEKVVNFLFGVNRMIEDLEAA